MPKSTPTTRSNCSRRSSGRFKSFLESIKPDFGSLKAFDASTQIGIHLLRVSLDKALSINQCSAEGKTQFNTSNWDIVH